MLIKQKVLFSEEECKLIIDLEKTNEQNWKLKDRDYKSQAIDLNENTEWIFNKLTNFLETETDIKIKKSKKQIHFHKFIKGNWFAKHNDIRDSRFFSIGVLLNDDFEGGDFILYGKNKLTLKKIKGNTYIFDVRIEHEILPILSGNRYSLLWFLGNEHINIPKNSLI